MTPGFIFKSVIYFTDCFHINQDDIRIDNNTNFKEISLEEAKDYIKEFYELKYNQTHLINKIKANF